MSQKTKEKQKEYDELRKKYCKCGARMARSSKTCQKCYQELKIAKMTDEERARRNKESKRKGSIAYYYRHIDRVKITQKNFREKNREKLRSFYRNVSKRLVETLDDQYIRARLSTKSILKRKDIPQELIELYRLKLIAERLLNGTSKKSSKQNCR